MEDTLCAACFGLPALALSIFGIFKLIQFCCTYTGEGRRVKADYWGDYRPAGAGVVKLPNLALKRRGFDDGPHVHF